MQHTKPTYTDEIHQCRHRAAMHRRILRDFKHNRVESQTWDQRRKYLEQLQRMAQHDFLGALHYVMRDR